MKKLIMFLLSQVCWDSSLFAQTTNVITDTIHEPILVSTRVPGFVRTEMALAVRRIGVCIKHLDCHGHELKYPVYIWDCDNERKRRAKCAGSLLDRSVEAIEGRY